jgi:hypothetical protein
MEEPNSINGLPLEHVRLVKGLKDIIVGKYTTVLYVYTAKMIVKTKCKPFMARTITRIPPKDRSNLGLASSSSTKTVLTLLEQSCT